MESNVKLFGHPLHPMVVVFPLPLAPRNPQISPWGTWRVKPSTTRCCPKDLLSPRTSMTDEPLMAGAEHQPAAQA